MVTLALHAGASHVVSVRHHRAFCGLRHDPVLNVREVGGEIKRGADAAAAPNSANGDGNDLI